MLKVMTARKILPARKDDPERSGSPPIYAENRNPGRPAAGISPRLSIDEEVYSPSPIRYQ